MYPHIFSINSRVNGESWEMRVLLEEVTTAKAGLTLSVKKYRIPVVFACFNKISLMRTSGSGEPHGQLSSASLF